MAATTISTGRDEQADSDRHFSVLDKSPMYRSKKYDNAPMPFAQFFDPHGIALHGGAFPGVSAESRLRPFAERVRQEALFGHRRWNPGLSSARNLPRAAPGKARPLSAYEFSGAHIFPSVNEI